MQNALERLREAREQRIADIDKYYKYRRWDAGHHELPVAEYLDNLMTVATEETREGRCPAVILSIGQAWIYTRHSENWPNQHFRKINPRNIERILAQLPEAPKAVWDKCIELFGGDRVTLRIRDGAIQITVNWHK